METKKFSVIVGMYNHQKSLPKLIEALNNQTFKDFEVHFCDDGSKDYKDYDFSACEFPWEFHRLWFKRGMRLAKSINQGIKAAKGEYCVFIMADSFPEINYLEMLDARVDKESIVCGIRIQVDEDRGVDIDWRLAKGVVPPQEAVMMNTPWNFLTGNGLTIPTEALREYGMWDEKIEGYGGDDTLVTANLYFHGYLCRSVPSLKLYHHWHKGRTSENNPYVNSKISNFYLAQ